MGIESIGCEGDYDKKGICIVCGVHEDEHCALQPFDDRNLPNHGDTCDCIDCEEERAEARRERRRFRDEFEAEHEVEPALTMRDYK